MLNDADWKLVWVYFSNYYQFTAVCPLSVRLSTVVLWNVTYWSSNNSQIILVGERYEIMLQPRTCCCTSFASRGISGCAFNGCNKAFSAVNTWYTLASTATLVSIRLLAPQVPPSFPNWGDPLVLTVMCTHITCNCSHLSRTHTHTQPCVPLSAAGVQAPYPAATAMGRQRQRQQQPRPSMLLLLSCLIGIISSNFIAGCLASRDVQQVRGCVHGCRCVLCCLSLCSTPLASPSAKQRCRVGRGHLVGKTSTTQQQWQQRLCWSLPGER